MRTIRGSEELVGAVGEELGISAWHEVGQAQIDEFAAATGDHYWVHVDTERAAKGPLGSTIAHGLYTLSLGPMFTDAIVRFEGFEMTLNYGYEKVRFPAPVPVDSRLRMRSELVEVDVVDGGVRARLQQTFELDGGTKPACVAISVMHFLT